MFILVEFALWLAGGRWEGSFIEQLMCAENQIEQFLRQQREVGVVIKRQQERTVLDLGHVGGNMNPYMW